MAHTNHNQPQVADMFERTLLDSARSDGVSAEATEQAWLRFSGLLAGAAVSAGGAHAATRSVTRLSVFSRLAAAKYLLLGALSGSALTFAWFGLQRASQPTQRRAIAVTPAPPASVVATQSSNDSAPPSLLLKAARLRTMPAQARLATSPRSARLRDPALSAQSSAPESSKSEAPSTPSTLTAEVVALDAARAAARAGAYDRALDLLGQYRADFPAGALRADAEVASIEALYEKGEHTEAARRAARFLAQFPNDPHSTAVRRLLTP